MNKILNIGSINIDYVYDVRHFVRPGETISANSLNVFPGGKGLNQSIAFARAGASIYHAGRVGADGRGMIEVMRDSGVNTDLIDSSGKATGHAIIQVNDSGENCIILFPGANREFDGDFIDSALADFGAGDFLVLQNEINNISYCIEAAHKRGLRVAFNLAPFGSEIKNYPLELVDFFLFNEIEGRELSGVYESDDILNKMASLFPNASFVLTLGKDGVRYKDAHRTLSHGIYDVPVVDTTAAGDTFTGFFISALVEGEPTAEALRIASIASAIAVSRKGASSSVPKLSEVRRANLRYMAP
ncbi:ribokinase [Synergistales bacterium]|nr:ribokinase [Synergistales bacterium]